MAEERLPQFAENEDVARAKAFWNENGKPIIFGIAIGLVGIFGYNYWNSYQQSQGEEASIMFEQVRNASEDYDVGQIATRLKQDHPGSTYAVLSSFFRAKGAVQEGDLDSAASEFSWVLSNSRDEGMKHIARLRLASILLAQEKPDDVLAALSIEDMGSFDSRYFELRGDAYLQRNADGDSVLARKSYQQSLDSMAPGSVHIALVQLKLDNVGEI
jgi:predicted negative regulator of RcsB-dependent stress response